MKITICEGVPKHGVISQVFLITGFELNWEARRSISIYLTQYIV